MLSNVRAGRYLVSLRQDSRVTRFRLEAELVRDVLLATAGLLSTQIGGPSVFPPQPESVTALAYGSFRPRACGQPFATRRMKLVSSPYSFARYRSCRRAFGSGLDWLRIPLRGTVASSHDPRLRLGSSS